MGTIDDREVDEVDVLQVSVHANSDVHTPTTVVVVQGELDAYGVHELRGELEPLFLTVTPDAQVTLDLQCLSYIDSDGMSLLAEMHRRFQRQTRGRLSLIVARGSQPERVLRLGRFHTVFRILESPEAPSASS